MKNAGNQLLPSHMCWQSPVISLHSQWCVGREICTHRNSENIFVSSVISRKHMPVTELNPSLVCENWRPCLYICTPWCSSFAPSHITSPASGLSFCCLLKFAFKNAWLTSQGELENINQHVRHGEDFRPCRIAFVFLSELWPLLSAELQAPV